MKQVPRIVQSPLTDSWFVVTRYREKVGIDTQTGEKRAYLVASVKYDVTDQMVAILKHARKTTGNKRGRSQRPTKGTPTPRASKS